jgi:hypothetical protein
MLKKLFVLCCALLPLAAARADVVGDWNAITSQVIATSNHSGPGVLIDFAIVHLAIHDAVQAIDHRYKPYHVSVPNASGSRVAAAARAARDVLISRFPSQSASIDASYTAYLATHSLAPDDPGVQAGQAAATGIIALRATDGSFPSVPPPPFTGGTGIGEWRPTPSFLAGSPAAFSPMAAPWLATVTPFTVKSATQFRPKPPPAVTSALYAAEFNEAKALGGSSSTTRTAAQTETGYFWSDNTPLQWHRALRAVAAMYVTDTGNSARLFALASMAAADAIITCWDSKIHYDYWRPVTAIHEADWDGNPLTESDPSWMPLLNTPNYPEYSSGANSVSGAMTRTFQLFFGRDDLPFSVTSNSPLLPGDRRTRSFARFSDAANEVVEARLFLGFHFRTGDVVARESGGRVAKWTFTHALKPLDEHED